MKLKRAILLAFAACLILSYTFSNAYESLSQPVMPPPVSKQKEKILRPLFQNHKIVGGQVIALKGSPHKKYSGNYMDVGTLGGVCRGDIFAVYTPKGIPVGFLKVTEAQRFTSTFEFMELQIDASENLIVKKVPDEIGAQLPPALRTNPKYALLKKRPMAPKAPSVGLPKAPVAGEAGMPALPGIGASQPALPALPGEGKESPALPALPASGAEGLPALPVSSSAAPAMGMPSLPGLPESGTLPSLAAPASTTPETVTLPAVNALPEPGGLPPLTGYSSEPALPSTGGDLGLPPLDGATNSTDALPPLGDLPVTPDNTAQGINFPPIARPEDLGTPSDMGLPPPPGADLGLPPGADLPPLGDSTLPLPALGAELPSSNADLSMADLPPVPGGDLGTLPSLDAGLPAGQAGMLVLGAGDVVEVWLFWCNCNYGVKWLSATV